MVTRLLLVATCLWLVGLAEGAEPAKGTPPQAVKRVDPAYPYALRLHGNKGEVLIEFVVDKQGEVRNPVIVKSSHPEFEAPAIEALLQWKFKPGVQGGRVVHTRMRLPISFELTGRVAVDPFKIAGGSRKELPPQFQYDEPPRPVLTGAPVYPFELLQQQVKGSATIAFVVDPTGHTRQVLVREASRPEFGAAAAAMISVWEFEPARKDRQPTWSLLTYTRRFDRNDRDSPVNESAARLLKVLEKNPAAVFNSLSDLDKAPQPRYQPGPVLPEAMRRDPTAATAEIEFVIDRAGRAQLPRVVSATREDFGWAAATAVARWQFNPPTKGGKPVDVKAKVPVSYVPGSGADTEGPAVPELPSGAAP